MLKNNIIANYIGRFWSLLSNFLFIPLYIDLLGIKCYSIISFSLVIGSLASILDLGLTLTLSKEMATNNNLIKKFKIFYTLEKIYIYLGIILIILFLVFSNNFIIGLINITEINKNLIVMCLIIQGLGISFQLLSNFYIGGLLGLEHQVYANILQVLYSFFKNGIVILVIFFFPSIIFFFIWQTLISIIFMFIIRKAVIKTLFSFIIRKNCEILEIDSIKPFKIYPKVLNSLRKFVGGIFLISLISMLVTQVDRIIISKFFLIEILGYYTIAYSIGQVLIILINPFAMALLPKFTHLYTSKLFNEAKLLYTKSFFFVNILALSLMNNILFYGKEIILLWTGNISVSNEASKFIPYLAIGSGFLSLQILPYNIAISNSYTKANTIISIFVLFIIIPGYWFSTIYFGSIGPAVVWAIIQIIVTPIYIYSIHYKFLDVKNNLIYLLFYLFLPALFCFILSFSFSRIYNYSSFTRFSFLFWFIFINMASFIIVFFVNNKLFNVFSYSELKGLTKIFRKKN